MVERDLAIAITERCNKQCEYCYTDAKYTSESCLQADFYAEELSTEEWLNVLDQAVEAGYTGLHIYGGEPFMRRDLQAICTYASKKKTKFGRPMRILLATNGTRITDLDLLWIKSTDSHLSITINEIIEPNPFVLNLVQNLIDQKINFVVSTCISSKNIDNYADFVQSMNIRYGTQNIQFFGIYFSKLGRGKRCSDLFIAPEKWIQFRKSILEKFDNVSIENIYATDDSLFSCSCGIETGNFLVVGATGNVFPCLLLLNESHFLLGNIKQENFNSILEKIFKILQFKTQIMELCKGCEAIRECEGGCPAYCEFDDCGLVLQKRDYRCDNRKKFSSLFCPLFATRE
jgi:radical SAM protein with 4Fe4S-binding SPASM domain